MATSDEFFVAGIWRLQQKMDFTDRLWGENKIMDEVKTDDQPVAQPTADPSCTDASCPDCEARKESDKKTEELMVAFLVALMPLMTMTLFGNLGLL